MPRPKAAIPRCRKKAAPQPPAAAATAAAVLPPTQPKEILTHGTQTFVKLVRTILINVAGKYESAAAAVMAYLSKSDSEICMDLKDSTQVTGAALIRTIVARVDLARKIKLKIAGMMDAEVIAVFEGGAGSSKIPTANGCRSPESTSETVSNDAGSSKSGKGKKKAKKGASGDKPRRRSISAPTTTERKSPHRSQKQQHAVIAGKRNHSPVGSSSAKRARRENNVNGGARPQHRRPGGRPMSPPLMRRTSPPRRPSPPRQQRRAYMSGNEFRHGSNNNNHQQQQQQHFDYRNSYGGNGYGGFRQPVHSGRSGGGGGGFGSNGNGIPRGNREYNEDPRSRGGRGGGGGGGRGWRNNGEWRNRSPPASTQTATRDTRVRSPAHRREPDNAGTSTAYGVGGSGAEEQGRRRGSAEHGHRRRSSVSSSRSPTPRMPAEPDTYTEEAAMATAPAQGTIAGTVENSDVVVFDDFGDAAAVAETADGSRAGVVVAAAEAAEAPPSAMGDDRVSDPRQEAERDLVIAVLDADDDDVDAAVASVKGKLRGKRKNFLALLDKVEHTPHHIPMVVDDTNTRAVGSSAKIGGVLDAEQAIDRLNATYSGLTFASYQKPRNIIMTIRRRGRLEKSDREFVQDLRTFARNKRILGGDAMKSTQFVFVVVLDAQDSAGVVFMTKSTYDDTYSYFNSASALPVDEDAADAAMLENQPPAYDSGPDVDYGDDGGDAFA